MVAFGVQPHSDVSVEAELSTVSAVGRTRDALPEAWFTSRTAPSRPESGIPGLARWVPAGELPGDLAVVGELLPLTVSTTDRPVGSVEGRFAAAVGPHPAEIRWSGLSWPGAPERGLHAENKHAGVTLLLNCDSLGLDIRGDTHLLLVHVRPRNRDGYEDRCAGWLAEQVGRTVIGPPHA